MHVSMCDVLFVRFMQLFCCCVHQCTERWLMDPCEEVGGLAWVSSPQALVQLFSTGALCPRSPSDGILRHCWNSDEDDNRGSTSLPYICVNSSLDYFGGCWLSGRLWRLSIIQWSVLHSNWRSPPSCNGNNNQREQRSWIKQHPFRPPPALDCWEHSRYLHQQPESSRQLATQTFTVRWEYYRI
jgi:hypothetical protein